MSFLLEDLLAPPIQAVILLFCSSAEAMEDSTVIEFSLKDHDLQESSQKIPSPILPSPLALATSIKWEQHYCHFLEVYPVGGVTNLRPTSVSP